jgi:hypothetical protein
MKKVIFFCLMSLLVPVVYPCNFGSDESYLSQLGTPSRTQGSPSRFTRPETPAREARVQHRPSTPVLVETPGEAESALLPENRRLSRLLYMLLATFLVRSSS